MINTPASIKFNILLVVYAGLLTWLIIQSQLFIGNWIIIESISLVFLCIILEQRTKSRFTSNILYFVIQATTSIAILFFILLNIKSIAILFILTKIGSMPLSSIYLHSLLTAESIILSIALTTQKLPPIMLFIVDLQSTPWIIQLVMIIILITSIRIIITRIMINPLREVLLLSSIFNSRWIVLIGSVSLPLLICYLLVYIGCLLLIITKTNKIIPLITIIGLPPLPLFFIKLSSVYYLFISFCNPLLIIAAVFGLFVSSQFILSIYYKSIIN